MKLGLPVILTLIFLVLKLTGHITWSWLWVFAPMWMSFIIGAVIGIAVTLLAMYVEKNMTPEQRLKRACDRMAAAIKNQR